MLWNLVRLAVTALPLLLPAVGQASALEDLNGAFRSSYRLAQLHTLSNLRATVPVMVNRFSQIALYRPGVARPELFEADEELLRETRAVAHSAASLYLRLAPFGLGRLDAERIHQRGEVDEATLTILGATVRAATDMGFRIAVGSTLDQFRAQFASWRQQYPALDWTNAVAIIIGTHQPRNLAWQRQFLDWMLRDDPRREDRMVFAETLGFPAPIDGPDGPTDVLLLLASVMLDKALAGAILGDPLVLQTDALGPAAQEIIRGWSAP